MRFAICADLHNNYTALERVLADAAAQQTDELIFLGDAGADESLLAALQENAAVCLFGNWEVSGLLRLPPRQRTWVAGWPALHQVDGAVYCHATPDMPESVPHTQAAADYMRRGISWLDLFPRLHIDDNARWRAFAMLEEIEGRVAFHGHTHVQQVWVWETTGQKRRLQSFTGPADFELKDGSPGVPNRYLVGVGSAGQPQDGTQVRYAIFDTGTDLVTLRALTP